MSVLTARTFALAAWVTLAAFAAPVSGISALTEAEGDCDCSSRHEDGDDEDHCPPFCGSCSDCAGCFHLHAMVTSPPAPLGVVVRDVPLPTPQLCLETPPEPPGRAPVHVPRAHA